ncbi:MAG TPA: HAD family phosphatase [Ruminococcus sp.]|nr:HAD family phosphatase [Ruminococcus sp.]
MDGTLADSMHVWCDVDKKIIEKYGGTYTPEISEKLKTMTIEQSSDFFIKMLGLDKTPDEVAKEVAQTVFNQYRYEIKLKENALNILNFLEENGIPFCIATSTHKMLAETFLQRYDIEKRFEFILTGEDIPKSKKFPDIYIECSKLMNTEISETLVAEDSLHCVQTTVKAGFPTVAVYDNFNKNDFPEMIKLADKYIYNLGELPNIIKEW